MKPSASIEARSGAGGADDELQRSQIGGVQVGVEQHPHHRRLDTRTLQRMGFHHSHPMLDGKSLQQHHPLARVHPRHQLTHSPDATERPVHQFRRIVGRCLAAGDTEHRVFEHRRSDREPLRRAGGSAGEDVERAVIRRARPGGITFGEHGRFGGQGDDRRPRLRGPCPVVRIGQHGRQVELVDIPGDGLSGLEGVDHQHRPRRSQRADDRRRMREPVTHHHADGCVRDNSCLTELSVKRGNVGGDVAAGEPAFLELHTRLVSVAGQGCRKGFGKSCRSPIHCAHDKAPATPLSRGL
jgi:hypothetical protein